MSRTFALALLPIALAAVVRSATAEDGDRPDTLVRAYPEELAGHDETGLVWRDGTRMPLSDGEPAKSLDAMLRHGSILDQLRIAYPAGAITIPPGPGDDPGRIRNVALFDKMYGDCRKGEVTPRLVPVVWLPRSWGHTIRATSVNHVAERLSAISEELEALPDALKRYAYPPGGTYNCRAVADTGQPSMHGWGAAIDLNPAHAEYWEWRRSGFTDGPTHRIPSEIVDIFERHGFIWGGKWFHYDTMHFEYRPELLTQPAVPEQWAIAPGERSPSAAGRRDRVPHGAP